MTIKNTVLSVEDHLKASWAAVREQGGELPEQLNMANLAAGILSIVGGGGKGDLGKFKKAMHTDYAKAQTNYPVGTEFEDTYAGNPNPLIVAQYLDSSNNSAYGGAVGAIMVRKYVEPTNQQWNGSASSFKYFTSSIGTFLATTYYNNSSEALKEAISDITIGWGVGSVGVVKWFLMASSEVGGALGGYSSGTGIFWPYWQQKMGLTSPSNAASAGRIPRSRDGAAVEVWLRDTSNSVSISFITSDGGVSNDTGVQLRKGVLPACFISKD